MKSFMKKLKNELTPKNNSQAVSANAGAEIQDSDTYRYRKQRGVNLGSWFVLERWIIDEPFKSARPPAQSDLDIALGGHAKETLERHWDTWIQYQDWEWISRRGINSVRIPIGYYHLCGADPSVLHGTDFQPHHEVYAGAWSRLARAIQTASAYNIGVLIDLHAAPGKQNTDAHAGTSNQANFFNDPYNMNHTIRVLCSLVTQLNQHANSFNPPLTNIIGVELLSEPNPPTDHVLQKWYTNASEKIRAIDPSMPIYLGECWRTESYAEYIAKHPSSALTVLDHHLYRCFTSEDIHTSAEDLSCAISDPSGSLSRTLAKASEKLGRAGGGVIIGEWSGALNPASLRGPVNDEQKKYVTAQFDLFERSRICAGWFFWTYKKQNKGDSGWSLRDAVEKGVFPDFVGIRRWDLGEDDLGRINEKRDSEKSKALDAHKTHWSRYPGSYDHTLFESGFVAGWDAEITFLTTTSTSPKATAKEATKIAHQLGFIGAWARRMSSNYGKHYWEYEEGFFQGVDAAAVEYGRG